jgi:hypothetical protein
MQAHGRDALLSVLASQSMAMASSAAFLFPLHKVVVVVIVFFGRSFFDISHARRRSEAKDWFDFERDDPRSNRRSTWLLLLVEL